MATPLPFQTQIDRTSGPRKQGFDIIKLQYSSKVSQKFFDGPNQEASRNETWTVRWKQLEFFDAAAVLGGAVSTLTEVREFYEGNYLGEVEWQPFEVSDVWIWEIVPGSWKQTNPAGHIFDVSIDLKFLYKQP